MRTENFFPEKLVFTSVIQQPMTEDEILHVAKKIVAKRFYRFTMFDSSKAACDYFILRLGILEHEVFCVAFLDSAQRVIACEELFRGSINITHIHPREIVKRALHHNAAAIILAHNHPSGNALPSTEDKNVTQTLAKALALVEISIIDHIVVGGVNALSFAERGLL